MFNKKLSFIWTPLHTLVTLSLAATFLTGVLHISIPGVQQGLQQQVTLVLFFFLGAQLFSNTNGQQQLLNITVASAALVALIGIAQYLSQSRLGLPATSANASVFINKNYAGAFMDLATPAAFILLLDAKDRGSRLWRTTSFFLCLGYSLITLSRGHWLALAVALSLLLILFTRNKTLTTLISNNKTSQWLAILVMIATPMLLLFPPLEGDIAQESTAVTNQLSDSGSIGDRLGFYRNTLQLIADKPFFGIGPGSFYTGFQDYYNSPVEIDAVTEMTGIAHAHNDYLEYLAELGIPAGLIIILTLAFAWFSSWVRSSHNDQEEPHLTSVAYFLGFSAILSHALIDFPLNLPVSSIFLWTWMGAASVFWLMGSAGKKTNVIIRPRLRLPLIALSATYLLVILFSGYNQAKANLLIKNAAELTIQNKCDTAKQLAAESLALASDDYVIWHYALVTYGYCPGTLGERYALASRILERAPSHPQALLFGANTLFQAGELDRAIDNYRRLAEVLPLRASGFLGLANTFSLQGSLKKADEFYEKAQRRIDLNKRPPAIAGPAGRNLLQLTRWTQSRSGGGENGAE